MKVLSIREPWASLIINGYKEYEFRTWKTNYRGKILIHASRNIEKDNIIRFEEIDLVYKPGFIIGEAELVDCIPVTKDFEDDLIKKDELVYGASRDRGGYAWKLKNIRRINPKEVKGKLGLWNYDIEI
ncbi:MAG: ASCH domain-containing protein [Clostridia bacterium]|nr:ASCH domain-containing protein [Clostridia bacterium]